MSTSSGPRPPQCRGFTITLRHTTLGRTPLEEWSAQCRDLYLTTHNTHNRQTSMPPALFEPTIPASELSQTHDLDRAATGIGTGLMGLSIPEHMFIGKGKVVLAHALNACKKGLALITSLTLALDRGEWSASRPGHFIPGNETRYLLKMRLVRLQRRFGHLREDEPLDPAGIRTPDSPVCSLVTMPTTLPRIFVLTAPCAYLFQYTNLYKTSVIFIIFSKDLSVKLWRRASTIEHANVI
jgi:hypothetical protein